MPRYILISFLFLGFAFYELSGGSDFEPRSKSTPVDTAEATETEPRSAIERARLKRATEVVTLVAAPVIETSDSRLSGTPEQQATPVIQAAVVASPEPVEAAVETIETLQPNVSTVADASQETTIADVQGTATLGLSQFATAEDAVIEVAAVQEEPPLQETNVEEAIDEEEPAVRAPAAASADLRQIVATRVNMRAGPGTSHDILDRLSRGATVEVLGDNGRGWLRLRTLPGDRVGWIAERLVSPAS